MVTLDEEVRTLINRYKTNITPQEVSEVQGERVVDVAVSIAGLALVRINPEGGEEVDVANLLVPKPTRESNMRRVIAHVHQFDAILQRDTMQRLHDLLGGPAFVTQACKTYPKKQFKTEGHVRLLSEEERALVKTFKMPVQVVPVQAVLGQYDQAQDGLVQVHQAPEVVPEHPLMNGQAGSFDVVPDMDELLELLREQ